jgi:hypothetical protein
MALKEFKTKRTQLWQYLNTSIDKFLRAVGLRTTKDMVGGPTSSPLANLYELKNKSYTVGNTEYKTYCFQSWIALTGSNVYVQDLGLINVSQGFMLITNQSTNIAADDTAGVGGFTNGAIANTGTLVEDNATSNAAQAALAYINQDNTLTGVDDNYLYLIVSNSALTTLDAEAYVTIEFVVEKAAKVEFIQF